MTDADLKSAPSTFPVESETFFANGPAGRLEVVTDAPDKASDNCAVAVICHPHPEHGGTLRNKVVHIMERALRELGLYTVRFNFRGVGKSEGEFGGGVGEVDDLKAVVAWVSSVKPGCELWLAGFSFGAFIAAKGAMTIPTEQLISIAPPVDNWDFSEFDELYCPWLVVQGDEDEVVLPDSVFSWAKKRDPAPQLVTMNESGHFFHRRLMDLRGVIKNGVRRQLKSTENAEEN